MAITITNNKLYRTNSNSVIWDNQSQASLSFFVRYESAGSADVNVIGYADIVTRAEVTMYVQWIGGYPAGQIGLHCWLKFGSGDSREIALAISTAVTYHIAVTFAQGSQCIWIDGIPHVFGDVSGVTASTNQPFQIGMANAPGSPAVHTISDVAVWNGYVLTATDVANLRDGTAPSTISHGTQFEWTLAGPTGYTPGVTVPQVGDSGLLNSFNDATYDIVAITGAGSAVYSEQLSFQPAAGIQTAYVGTSGKTIVLFFENLANSTQVMPIEVTTAPTIFKNGINLGLLTNIWLTGYHSCVVCCLPLGTSINTGDSVSLTAPTGWANTSAGIAEGLDDKPINNFTGKSAFGTESLVKTMRMGLNFADFGTASETLYQVSKNWRHRLDGFSNMTSVTSDGKPITFTGSHSEAQFLTHPYTNLIDSTGFPTLTGLYAIGWDDLNTSNPTTFSLTWWDSTTTTITPRTDLTNVGTNGIGNVRVFDVQRTANSPDAGVYLYLRIDNATGSPEFDNLFIYGPGDFSYQNNVPVVLDRSNPYALNAIFLDRFRNSLGVARWAGAVLSWANAWNQTEINHIPKLSDFTWGWGNLIMWDNSIIAFTQVRPYSTSTSPYVYSTFFGSPFIATLASDIDNATTTLTISDAPTAPVLAGLHLSIGSETMRVTAVSVTTVTVVRGVMGTTAASHSAGTIQVKNRYAVSSLSQIALGASNAQVVEFVTQSAHRLKTGHYPALVFSTPQVLFTDGSSFTGLNDRVAVQVTGANTFVANFSGASSGPVTLSNPVTLDPGISNITWGVSSPGLPYDFIAIATSALPNCDLQINFPVLASDDFVRAVAQSLLSNFSAGRKIWIELSIEPWNYGFPQRTTITTMAQYAFPGENFYTWLVVRTGQIVDIIKTIFGGRSGEIKCLINTQCAAPSTTSNALNAAQAHNVIVDAIAVGPYIDPDPTSISVAAWNAADDDQAIDLWIHDLYYNPSSSQGMMMVNQLRTQASLISAYNVATGNACVLYAYEGGVQTTTPGNNIQTRTRDMIYNPNWYIIEQDLYAFYQRYGFSRFAMTEITGPYNGNNDWAVYHGIGQPYGRGDGSDGKANNRLCLATQGLPNSKSSSTNQDLQNVSVRGQVLIDWMRATSPSKKPRTFLRRHI